MKLKYFSFILCITFLVSGCSLSLEKEPVENTHRFTLGHCLEIYNTDSRLILTDTNSSLAADGLYYASWGIGDSEPYENSEGGTADLYDANLYLLLGESKTCASAQNNMDTWLNAAKTNYKVQSEEDLICQQQSYTLITYECVSEDNPYAHGMSAFGVNGNNAVCIELTCRENFDQDLKNILTVFLNNCVYTTD